MWKIVVVVNGLLENVRFASLKWMFYVMTRNLLCQNKIWVSNLSVLVLWYFHLDIYSVVLIYKKIFYCMFSYRKFVYLHYGLQNDN